MASASICRKRPHSDLDDDCDDCLPISKRINKLHIESARQSQDELLVKTDLNQAYNTDGCSPVASDPQLSPWQQAQIVNQNQACVSLTNQNPLCIPGPSPSSFPGSSPLVVPVDGANNNDMNGSMSVVLSGHGSVSMDDIQGYDPHLKEEENPHYFQVNSLLYNAHVSRVTRTKSFQILGN